MCATEDFSLAQAAVCSGWPKDASEDKFWSCSDRFRWFPAISKTFLIFLDICSNLEEQGLLHFIFSCAIVGMRTFPSPRLLCAAGGPKMLWRTSSGAVPIGFIGSQPFPKPF